MLSLSHPVGGSKATFFRTLGYGEETAALLAEELLEIGATGDIHATIETNFGVKYLIPGELTGPAGETRRIQTVWIVDRGQAALRFVTAYPLQEGETDAS